MVRVHNYPVISFGPEKTESAKSAIERLGRLYKPTKSYLRTAKISSSAVGLPPTPPESHMNLKLIKKYWKQRYELFSRYDEGILMDTEGWFSVTPEAIAKHHAERCGSGTIIDCFAGSGGNVIQFAMKSRNVIAVDIDQDKIDNTKNNAEIYGVGVQHGRVKYRKGDCRVVAPKLNGDVVFLSPPWGGPEYSKEKVFDVRTMPIDGFELFEMAMKTVSKSRAPKVVMFLPRNVDRDQLAEMALSVTPEPWLLEVEENYLNGKFKAVTAYFSPAPPKKKAVTKPKW